MAKIYGGNNKYILRNFESDGETKELKKNIYILVGVVVENG